MTSFINNSIAYANLSPFQIHNFIKGILGLQYAYVAIIEGLIVSVNSRKMPLILVVDDDWMNREVMEAHLQAADYDVMVAQSGENALELAFQRPPDLILLDVRMQGISGYEVCERLKSHHATRFAPVVIVTALESDADKLMAIRSGADDFIGKPFTSLAMLTRVKCLLRIKHLHDELEARNTALSSVLRRYVSEDIRQRILADLATEADA